MNKFIYNNNHVYKRVYNIPGKSKVIAKRDLSGHDGIICNRCGKEIFGTPPYQNYIDVETNEIVSIVRGKEYREKISKKPKEAFMDIMVAGVGEGASHTCGECVGRMDDFLAKQRSGVDRTCLNELKL